MESERTKMEGEYGSFEGHWRTNLEIWIKCKRGNKTGKAYVQVRERKKEQETKQESIEVDRISQFPGLKYFSEVTEIPSNKKENLRRQIQRNDGKANLVRQKKSVREIDGRVAPAMMT
ncbi:hypothetical protein V6N13_075640 [Hibiscus sabdariffa]|uniref:Uncharacterized protein n=1 Tax=Hibiscus sabdariffa TaxID=183260 RepID=A0ABR2UC56_9ROSI